MLKTIHLSKLWLTAGETACPAMWNPITPIGNLHQSRYQIRCLARPKGQICTHRRHSLLHHSIHRHIRPLLQDSPWHRPLHLHQHLRQHQLRTRAHNLQIAWLRPLPHNRQHGPQNNPRHQVRNQQAWRHSPIKWRGVCQNKQRRPKTTFHKQTRSSRRLLQPCHQQCPLDRLRHHTKHHQTPCVGPTHRIGNRNRMEWRREHRRRHPTARRSYHAHHAKVGQPRSLACLQLGQPARQGTRKLCCGCGHSRHIGPVQSAKTM